MANQTEAAAYLDVSTRRHRDLVKNGVLPPSKGPGGYDLDAHRVAYIRHLRGVNPGQHVGSFVPTSLAVRPKRLLIEIELCPICVNGGAIVHVSNTPADQDKVHRKGCQVSSN